MAIAGNLAQFKKSYKKKWLWPKMRFSESGPKLKIQDISSLPFYVSDQHAAFLLWRNGGVPEMKWYAAKQFAFEIDFFYGIGSDYDLQEYLLVFRNDLPRFAVPIAVVSNYLGDPSLLLTFPHDYRNLGHGRDTKVWFYTWGHEEVASEDQLRSLELVAPSIKGLISRLKEKPPRKYRLLGTGESVDGDANE
ncbi:MAG: hypothetical protein AAGJ40_23805 [Planctomycetota bacterium]